MANAARVHAIERGKVLRDFTMIAFGGAAPLHAARLAQKLGIAPRARAGRRRRRLGDRLPARAGRVRSRAQRPPGRWRECDAGVAQRAASRHARAGARRRRTGRARAAWPAARAAKATRQADASCSAEERLVELRYAGQGHELPIALPAGHARRAALDAARANASRPNTSESTAARSPDPGRGRDLAADAVDDRVAGRNVGARTSALPNAGASHRHAQGLGARRRRAPSPFDVHWRFDLAPTTRVAGRRWSPSMRPRPWCRRLVRADRPAGPPGHGGRSAMNTDHDARDDDHPVRQSTIPPRYCSRSRSR